MTTTIDRSRSSNSANGLTASGAPSYHDSSLLGFYTTGGFDLQALLRKLHETMLEMQNAQTTLSATADTSSTEAESTPGVAEGSTDTPASHSTMSLTQALRSWLMTNASKETIMAQLQTVVADGMNSILEGQTNQTTDALAQLNQAIAQEREAEEHQSHWSRFTHLLSAAYDKVKEGVNKVAHGFDQGIGQLTHTNFHLAENVTTGLEKGLEGTVQGFEDGLNDIQKGFQYCMDGFGGALAKAILAMDPNADPKIAKILGDVLAAVIVTLVVTAVTFGAGTVESAAGEAALEGAELGAEGADLGNVAAEGVNAGGNAAAGAGQTDSILGNIVSKTRSFLGANRANLSILAATGTLQNSGFPKDLAVCCTDDPKIQAIIEGAVTACLTIITIAASYKPLSSITSGLQMNTNAVRALTVLQTMQTAAQIASNAGVIYWDFQLANIIKTMGQYQSNLDSSEGLLSITESQMSQSTDYFSNLMKTINQNVTTIANLIPASSRAEADAMENTNA